MGVFKDLFGQQFGRLLVKSRAPNMGEAVAWTCQCECGREKAVRAQSLLAGTAQSCGCVNAAKTRYGCTVEGCHNPHYAHGLCGMHGTRFSKRGTTDPLPITGQYIASSRADNKAHQWEHRAVAERALGRPLPRGVQVHHVDDNGRNNANDNLVICQDHAYHKDLHRRRRIFRAGGNPHTDWWCSGCRKPRPISLFTVRRTGPYAGRPTCYCSTCAPKKRKAWAER